MVIALFLLISQRFFTMNCQYNNNLREKSKSFCSFCHTEPVEVQTTKDCNV